MIEEFKPEEIFAKGGSAKAADESATDIPIDPTPQEGPAL